MGILIAFAMVICVVALVATLFALRRGDANYSMNTSLKNLSAIYIILIPIIGVILVGAWFLFR